MLFQDFLKSCAQWRCRVILDWQSHRWFLKCHCKSRTSNYNAKLNYRTLFTLTSVIHGHVTKKSFLLIGKFIYVIYYTYFGVTWRLILSLTCQSNINNWKKISRYFSQKNWSHGKRCRYGIQGGRSNQVKASLRVYRYDEGWVLKRARLEGD